MGGIREAGTTYAIPYVQVPDVSATCVAVEEHGGKVVVETSTTPDGLVWAQVTDPDGSLFGVFTPPAGPAT
jgi:predicted enzyme related to lactoylglutathione lyase